MPSELFYSATIKRALERTLPLLYDEYDEINNYLSDNNIRINPHFEIIIPEIKRALERKSLSACTIDDLLKDIEKSVEGLSVKDREDIQMWENHGKQYVCDACGSYLVSYAYRVFATCIKSELAQEQRINTDFSL